MPRPNLIKIADAAQAMLATDGGGWTVATAVADALGHKRLSPAELERLQELLAERSIAWHPGMVDTPAPAPADPFDTDEGPFYDPAKALDDDATPGTAEETVDAGIEARIAAERELDDPDAFGRVIEPGSPEAAAEDMAAQDAADGIDPADEDAGDDPGAWEASNPDAHNLPDRAERERPDDTVGQIVGPDGATTIDVPRWAAEANPRLSEALAAASSRGPAPDRRSTRELLAEAEDTVRRLRVRLLNEAARERLDDGRPLPSEAMRSLEALHALRKTLRPAAFDQVMGSIVAEIERDWGPIVT